MLMEMSESSLSKLDTMRITFLTLQDSPDVLAGVANRKIIDGLGGLFEVELLQIFKNPVSWKSNSLLPCDIYTSSDDDLLLYKSYLQKFYEANKHSVASAADAVMKCLEKENSLRELWMSSKVKVIACDASLSDEILECMSQLVGNKERLSLCPFIADAAACIEGEAELMINWLTWRDPPSKEFVLSRSIRRCALELAKIEGLEWSSDTAAFLLGIKKEARWLCENMMCDGFDSGFSTMIRGCAFELLSWKQDEYTSDGDVDVAVDMDIPILADHKAG